MHNMTGKNKTGNNIFTTAPHIKAKQSVKSIMWLVVLSLIPANIYSVYHFGIGTLLVIAASILGALLSETIMQIILKKKITVTNGSAVVTGLLLAMIVPPETPAWMAAIGSCFAISIAKQIFGGLGYNILNPALSGWAFMLVIWPDYMTTKWFHFSKTNILAQDITNTSNIPKAAFDAVTQATPLNALKQAPQYFIDMNISLDSLYELLFSSEMLQNLFIGNTGGCIGETSALLLLLGGFFLLHKRIITWHIPVSFIGVVAVSMLLYHLLTDFPFPLSVVLFHILSGGLILGAFFMATDTVTTPLTAKGMIIFGAGCGFITTVIRLWSGFPEGVSFSILIMNALVPFIDNITKPRVFGIQ